MTRSRYNRGSGQPGNQRIAILAVVIAVLLLCVIVPVVVLVSNLAGRTSGANQPAVSTNNSQQATLTVAYSPEKAALFKSLADKFNAKALRTPDRQTMRVELIEMTPDEMVNQALKEPKFQALTPDSSLWLDQLNRRYQANQPKADAGQIAPQIVGDTVRYAVTPIVIAAWDDAARSLGWPSQPVSWSSLQARAQQDANFKWNHPSTSHASGLLATLAEFYAGAGVQRGLTADLAQKQSTLDFVKAVEKTVKYYGEDELAVAQRAAQQGPKYLDAFVVSEQIVVAFNSGTFGKPPAHLVALYPAEGTLWADHPLALLETPSLTANQRRTFQALREYLDSSEVQQAVLAAGYRPADLNMPLTGAGSPLTAANGVDPKQPQTTLQLPSGDVVAVVQNAWELTKRRTNVFLVVDTSGSMQGQKLTSVKEALKTFVAQIPTDQERVGLVEFSSSVNNIIELDTLANNRDALNRRIDALQAGGNTALYDGVRTAYNRLEQLNDPERINAIVVMTDGIENASKVSLQQLTGEIQNGNKNLPVLIFTVGYGRDADTKTLQLLADAGGGQALTGNEQTIQDLYKILSTYF